MGREQEPPGYAAAMRVLHRVDAALNSAGDLTDTLQAVADGVVTGLGFEAAAVNLVRPDGDLEVAAVAGGDDVRETLAGRVGSRSAWDDLLSNAQVWGGLRFVE